MKLISIVTLFVFSVMSFASEENAVLDSFADGVATYTFEVCNKKTSTVSADVEFQVYSDKLAYAKLKFNVEGDIGYCTGGRKTISLNVNQLVKEKVIEKNIESSTVLLESLPTHIEF